MRAAVIVAAGSATRYGADKLAADVLGRSVLQRSVDIFTGIADVIVVVGRHDFENVICVDGGNTRTQSVLCGLRAVPDGCDIVAVHDGARPFASRALVRALFDAAEKYGSAVPTVPVTDTVWRQSENGLVPQARSSLMAVQTPQVFDYKRLLAALCDATDGYTDESTLFAEKYGSVHLCDGQVTNKKITYGGDAPLYRVGNGFDVHPFCEGDGVLLGGVKIPYDKKLLGHSDADVLAHAVCDAVLSASGNKDIGHQFPDTDDAYLGADSIKLLQKCVELAANNGFFVVNATAVVICQQPRLAPYIDEIVRRLATALDISPACVSVSATTTEHLGALGNGDGIAATATVLLCRLG